MVISSIARNLCCWFAKIPHCVRNDKDELFGVSWGGISLRGIFFECWCQFVWVDSVALILCGGCPPGELREGSGEITRPFFRIDGFEKMSVFSEHFMRFGNMDHRRNRQTTQFRQKRPHPHRRPDTAPLPRRISDNRAGFVRKQRTAEVIEQMRQSRAHRMIVFRTHHDIAIRCCNLVG